MSKLGAGTMVLAALLFAPDAFAAWQQPVGGASPINQAATRDANETSIATIGGVPYVAWSEYDGGNVEIRVARFNANGDDWVQPWFEIQVGGRNATATDGAVNNSPSRDGHDPSLAELGGKAYVAWAEDDPTVMGNSDIRVARLDSGFLGLQGLVWNEPWDGVSAADGGINLSQNEPARNPSLASVAGTLWIAWEEADSMNTEIRVARLDGDEWVHVPSPLNPTDGGVNFDNTRSGHDPSIADVGGVPHVAWVEHDADGHPEIRVAKLAAGGNSWEEIVGGPSPVKNQADWNADDPSTGSLNGTPYVAWDESDATQSHVRVARLNGAGNDWIEPWATASGGIKQGADSDGQQASLTTIGGELYVTWTEDDPIDTEFARTRVARLDQTRLEWDQIPGGPNPLGNPAQETATAPRLAGVGGVPWVSWDEAEVPEDHHDILPSQIRVSRLEPEFTSASVVPTSTGATLIAGVHTFGVPFPVGFQFGPNFENETATQTTAAGQQDVVVPTEISGLQPDTDQQFRPFSTAGVPLPRVLGPTTQFRTLVEQQQPGGGDPPGGGNPPGGGDPPGGGTPPGGGSSDLPGAGGPAGPGNGSAPVADTRAPALANYRLTPTSFRAASSGASIAGRRARPIGTKVVYSVSEAATVTFTVEKKATGRSVSGRCVKQTRRNRNRRKCTRFAALRGNFTHAARAGTNKLTFRGRLANRKLAAGSYRLNARAADAAKNASPLARRNFKIVRR